MVEQKELYDFFFCLSIFFYIMPKMPVKVEIDFLLLNYMIYLEFINILSWTNDSSKSLLNKQYKLKKGILARNLLSYDLSCWYLFLLCCRRHTEGEQ